MGRCGACPRLPQGSAARGSSATSPPFTNPSLFKKEAGQEVLCHQSVQKLCKFWSANNAHDDVPAGVRVIVKKCNLAQTPGGVRTAGLCPFGPASGCPGSLGRWPRDQPQGRPDRFCQGHRSRRRRSLRQLPVLISAACSTPFDMPHYVAVRIISQAPGSASSRYFFASYTGSRWPEQKRPLLLQGSSWIRRAISRSMYSRYKDKGKGPCHYMSRLSVDPDLISCMLFSRGSSFRRENAQLCRRPSAV